MKPFKNLYFMYIISKSKSTFSLKFVTAQVRGNNHYRPKSGSFSFNKLSYIIIRGRGVKQQSKLQSRFKNLKISNYRTLGNHCLTSKILTISCNPTVPSHVFPLKPFGHAHVNSTSFSKHVPAFVHGLG